MLQKKKCILCHQQGQPHVTINKAEYICKDCMAKEREAMLSNPKHPGWQYYNLVATALGMKAKTDD
jgi:recombinational DNA repair protein (RecF pathway)